LKCRETVHEELGIAGERCLGLAGNENQDYSNKADGMAWCPAEPDKNFGTYAQVGTCFLDGGFVCCHEGFNTLSAWRVSTVNEIVVAGEFDP
jgi:hypothetical protein